MTICLTAFGGISERVGKAPSIFTYGRVVCGLEFDRACRNWLLA